tara:strand:+ start:230 stop:361 length:132 start_codon:yes stop_codon:yes gene_type:complete
MDDYKNEVLNIHEERISCILDDLNKTLDLYYETTGNNTNVYDE